MEINTKVIILKYSLRMRIFIIKKKIIVPFMRRNIVLFFKVHSVVSPDEASYCIIVSETYFILKLLQCNANQRVSFGIETAKEYSEYQICFITKNKRRKVFLE